MQHEAMVHKHLREQFLKMLITAARWGGHSLHERQNTQIRNDCTLISQQNPCIPNLAHNT